MVVLGGWRFRMSEVLLYTLNVVPHDVVCLFTMV